MNPLLLKFGIPMAIIGIIAAMRWANVKVSGEPYFPGVGDTAEKKPGGGGAAGIFGEIQAMNSPADIQDSGTYYDYYEDNAPPSDDTTPDPTEWQGEVAAPGPGATNISGALAGHPGSNVGGYNVPGGTTGPVAGAITAATSGGGGYTGGYVPYQPSAPAPTPQPVANQFGGMGGGGVYAF